MTVTIRLALAFIVGVALAIVISPFTGLVAAKIGLHYPFPHLFDRTAMATIALAIIVQLRELEVVPLLREGFAGPTGNVRPALLGFAIGLGMIAILFAIAMLVGTIREVRVTHALGLVPKYLLSAIVIAIIEEGFFRAFLCGWMLEHYSRITAIVGSAIVYSLAHVVRSPQRFYVASLNFSAGLRTVEGSFAQLAHPLLVLPTAFGLFLLGVVLAAAFIETGRSVYLPMGLHAGVVVGSKLWPRLLIAWLPGWLIGWGSEILISGAAAWLLASAVLAILLRPIYRARMG